ncbi:response regulator, partial [bacterium]|nr:response regulator [bacterium]
QNLLQLQKIEAIGALAGGIAHDFNNLLTGIIGYLDMLDSVYNEGLNENQTDCIENALKSSNQAVELIKQIQSLSRGTIDEKTNIDLYEISNDVFTLLKNTTNRLIKKSIDLKPGEFYITAVPSEIHQVLLNLGTNAAQAIEERGVKRGDYIGISAKEHTITGGDKTGLPEGEYIHIFFEDSGKGMSDEVKRKVFDPLFTTRSKSSQKGQGLGLAMVYNIITRNHNGHISIESEEGKGTTFHIYIPRSEPPEKPEPKEVIGVIGGDETILIVEDEKMIRVLAKRILIKFGYKVLLANDGKEGLDIYTANKDTIDLVLLDLIMPEMSGEMLLEEMMKINRDVKVIISSGHIEEDTYKGILLAAKGRILKPYKATDLAQTVRTILDL